MEKDIKFNKDYYINSKISNYENYLEVDRTEMAEELINLLNIKKNDYVLDYGCACGNLIKALDKRLDHVTFFGIDVSDWAIEQAANRKYNNIIHLNPKKMIPIFDHILCLDVLEHMNDKQIREFFERIKGCKNLIMRIPVARQFNGRYVLGVSERDETHIQRMTRDEWLKIFSLFGYTVHDFINMKTIYDSEGVLCVWLKGEGNE